MYFKLDLGFISLELDYSESGVSSLVVRVIAVEVLRIGVRP